MRIFMILTIFLAVVYSNHLDNSKEKFLKQYPSSRARSESLGRLLNHIFHEYFTGCIVITIYDDKVNTNYPGLVNNLNGDLSDVSFVRNHLNNSLDQSPLKCQNKCYHYLMFLNNIYDITKVLSKESTNKVVIVSQSTPWIVKEFLKSFSSRSYTNLLVITHSMSERTEQGSYLLYTHKLYVDGSGASFPFLLTSWIGDRMTQKAIDLFPKKLSGGFKGHRLLIATAHQPPFAIRTNVITGSKIDWDGIDIRMIQLLSKTLNFTADFRDPVTINSPVYAATADVITGKASVAAGGIYKTTNITSVLDTSVSHMEDCAAFISSSSLALPKYRAVMGPFQPGVWVLICIVYFIAIIPLTINSDYSLRSLITRPSRFIHMFWFVFSTFTNSFVVKNPLNPNGFAKNSTALLIGVYWAFTIIITSCYTGSIMAFITVPMFPESIDTIDQLLDEGYDVATLDHDGWEKWFNWTTIEDPVAVKLLKSLEYVPTVTEGVRNASDSFFWSYTFLGSKIVLDYHVQAEYTPNWSTRRSAMHISKECLVNFGVTLVLPKDSVYTHPFDTVIMRVRQSGLSQKIIRDVEWDIQRTAEGTRLPISEDYKRRKVIIEERQLALDDTQGMFLVLGAGILIASLVLLIECCVNGFKKKDTVADTTTTFTSLATTPRMSFLTVPKPWDIESSNCPPRPRRFMRGSI
ncbi:ionotropic receptor 21a [Microplitis mediator]|uniref:ionotropic receptor 21a n=1 Tax=Microplitis mediator TaxID=375433 RepID=UPI002552903D|nr:ionotropic receptor 21a [Microplitis mediator]